MHWDGWSVNEFVSGETRLKFNAAEKAIGAKTHMLDDKLHTTIEHLVAADINFSVKVEERRVACPAAFGITRKKHTGQRRHSWQ